MENIKIKTSDNLTLAGSYWLSSSNQGVILLHQNSLDRQSYNKLAEEINQAGFHVLTIDFRGRGESEGELKTEEQYDAIFNDARAADEWLSNKVPGIKTQLIGASIGANTALKYQEMNTMKSVILLSPSKNYFGINPTDSNLSNIATPIFYINCEEDVAAQDTKELYEESHLGPDYKKLKIYPGKWHGVHILDNIPEAKKEVIDWLIKWK